MRKSLRVRCRNCGDVVDIERAALMEMPLQLLMQDGTATYKMELCLPCAYAAQEWAGRFALEECVIWHSP